MTKTKSTKRALLLSALALLACVSMLVGSTFAWFTDNVTSAGNRIVSGVLTVDLLMDKDGTYTSIKNGTGDIFSEETGNGVLWEPGKTEIVYLAVANTGTLDLKYNILLNVTDGGLIGSLEYAVLDNVKKADMIAEDWEQLKSVAQTGDVQDGIMMAAPNGAIKANADPELARDYFALAVHMKEEAGNEYQDKHIVIDVTVQASQLASESDSFGNDYDTLATFQNGVYQLPPMSGTTQPENDGTFEWTNENNTFTISGFAEDDVDVSADPASTGSDIVALAGNGKTVVTYDIKVDGQIPGSPVNVRMFLGKGLTNVQVFHEEDPIAITYDSLTGMVEFETRTFSLYSFAFSTLGLLPLANVQMMSPAELAAVTPEDVIVATLPNLGLSDSEAKPLETGYIFTAIETAEEAAAGKYANWHADFAVTFDGNVPTGSAALAGQYDDFSTSWFAFEAFDVDESDGIDGIPANQTFRLLEAFAEINYTELCRSIKVFRCGAYSLNDQVQGVTMTVELRLYETYPAGECPEDHYGHYSVNCETGNYETVGVYHYTF